MHTPISIYHKISDTLISIQFRHHKFIDIPMSIKFMHYKIIDTPIYIFLVKDNDEEEIFTSPCDFG